MTNFFRVALRPPDSSPSCRSGSASQDPGLPPSWDDEPGFELITCVSDGAEYQVDWTWFRADTPDQGSTLFVFSSRGRSLAPDRR